MKASVMSDSAVVLCPCQNLSIHLSNRCSNHSEVAVPPVHATKVVRCGFAQEFGSQQSIPQPMSLYVSSKLSGIVPWPSKTPA